MEEFITPKPTRLHPCKLQGSTSNNTSYDLGIQKPLPTGGRLDVVFPFSDSKTNNAWNTLNPAYDSDLKFSLSQPLLKNAGLRTNTHSIRVTEFEKKIEDAKTKLEAIRILANADKAYWMVYGASQELGVRQQQYKLAERQLNEAVCGLNPKPLPRSKSPVPNPVLPPAWRGSFKPPCNCVLPSGN